MPYFEQQNFKYGLDTRRSELTTQPGALEVLENAHINQGGEIEKRKAFADLAALPSGTDNTYGVWQTWGAEVTASGVTVFGHVPQSLVTTAGYTYQQLKHPAWYKGATFNTAYHRMTGVLCSTSFGGTAWVVAKFVDNSVWVYQNGVPIENFYNGVVLNGFSTLQQIAQQLADYISTITGLHVSAVASSGGNYYFDMWSDAGFSYTPVAAVKAGNAGSGTIKATNISAFTAGVTGTSATSGFTITAGSSANAGGVSKIEVYDNGGWVDILGVPVNFLSYDTLSTFTNNVTAQIATYVSGIPVTAVVVNDSVKLSYDVSQGTTPNGNAVRITCTGDCCVDNTVLQFASSVTAGTTCTSVKATNSTQLISGTPSYAVGGTYSQAVTNGTAYYWKPGANDTSLVCGTTTLTAAGTFIGTAAATATLNGTASALVTATIYTYIDILGATITAASTSSAAFAGLIAAQIRTFNTAYTAGVSGNKLIVSRKVTTSNGIFGNQIAITLSSGSVTDGSGVAPVAQGPMTVLITPSPATLQILNGTVNSSIVANAIVTGGTPDYTFVWKWISGSTYSGVKFSQQAIRVNVPTDPAFANQVSFSNTTAVASGTTLNAVFSCTVTDSFNLVAIGYVEVVFGYK
jgi:hypothetical protein